MAAEWVRISRVGAPKLKPRRGDPDQVEIDVRTAPRYPTGWREYYNAKVIELGVPAHHSYSGTDGDGITTHIREDEVEHFIEAIDIAVEYANDQYEATVLPGVLAERQRSTQKAEGAAQHQARLDELAARLAKPDNR